jgi:hypothetical protein
MRKEKSLVNHYAKYFQNSEDFQQELTNYDNFLNGRNGKFLKKIFADMKGLSAHRMFSSEFTKLSAEDKDMQQRVAYNIFQILDFIIEPRKWVRERLGILESVKKRLPSKSEKTKTKKGLNK